MKKGIILSYDYELFFGELSGTVLKTLIEPTNKLLDCMDSVGAKGSFFIDYLMFERLEKQVDQRAQTDLKLLKEQVKDIVRRGHRIELHLHPHWIDAVYNGDGTWDFTNFEHYSLYSLTKEEIDRQFREGVTYLTNLVNDIDPDYHIVAFRAGGWAIQPFELVKDCFKKYGIMIDSSVMHGVFQDNIYSKFDFRLAPNKEYYCFDDDVCVESDNGAFLEVPITVYSKPLWLRLVDKVISRFGKRNVAMTDGTHKRKDLPEVIQKSDAFGSKKYAFSLSWQTPVVVYYLLLRSKKKLITFIDHPKDFTYSTLPTINLCARNADFITYTDIVSCKQ